MKKQILLILIVAFGAVSALKAQTASCAPVISVSSTVPAEPGGGFCISVTATTIAGNRYPSVWEFWYLNPGTTAWHIEYNLGATIGSSGMGKGTVCYSPTWEEMALAGGYKIALMGIKSGAQLKFRCINFVPADEYPNYQQVYTQVAGDPTKWCDFSGTVTVNFGTSTTPGKGKKNNPPGKR